MKTVTLLIPCFNEEQSLPQLHSRLTAVLDSLPAYKWEILLVNDGSRDGTLEVMRQLRAADDRVCYLDLSRNFGKEVAMLAGLDHASGDALIILDADLQHPPEVIPEMLAQWEAGYDDVYARRTTRGKESWLRKKLSMAYYKLLQSLTRFDILENVGDFRLLDRRCIDALKQIRESDRYTKGLFCWIGFKKCEITFEPNDRVAGRSSFNLRQLFGLATDGITSFTTTPLRLSTSLGLTVSVLTVLYMLYFLIKTLIIGDPVQGFPTLIVVILFLGGVQLLSMGIIGEYLGRIFNETKRRPPYFIREEEGVKGKDNPSAS